MTESEAIKRIKECRNKPNFQPCIYMNEALNMAIKALEEVQKYRAIGTPEECRAAMERNNEKTRIIDGVTERCGYDFGTDAFQRKLYKFCPVCGRKIERSDEE